ncbi:hypothetical protein ABZW44_22650 [Streptomyces mirabilis]|uniref:hypothetical protein n=1 Tax=Streptomyces mirabilis TaxID=68239 RepID=UPI0033B106BE
MTNHTTPANQQPTETDLRLALTDAMDGNLRPTRRRDLLNAYQAAIEARVHAEHADTDDLRTRAESCAEGDCPHAHQARKIEREASGYRHELEGLADYLDDRDGIDPAVAATLRGILARALDR